MACVKEYIKIISSRLSLRYILIDWSNCFKEIVDEKFIDKTFFTSILVIVFFEIIHGFINCIDNYL